MAGGKALFALSEKAVFLRGEPLAPLTSFAIGGPAEYLLLPAEVGDFLSALDFARGQGMRWRILGSGTNILVPDEGLPGLTIKPWLQFSRIDIVNTMLTAQSGATMWEVARVAAKAGLGGMEWACGIPGTVGGAVFMNAGVKDADTRAALIEATVLRPGGGIEKLSPDGLALGYRSSALQREVGIVLDAAFRLRRRDTYEIGVEMNRFLDERRLRQPLDQPNCGSVFRNPPGDFAGRLIEACGCKGLRHGEVGVSELHANFIVNYGKGCAKDVIALVEKIRRKVREYFGIDLELEMRILE